MEIAVFLRESGDIDNEQWHKFSRRFFAEYRDTIMQYYGYESQVYYTLPRELVYPRFFIAVMSVLLELGVIRCKGGNWLKRFSVCLVLTRSFPPSADGFTICLPNTKIF